MINQQVETTGMISQPPTEHKSAGSPKIQSQGARFRKVLAKFMHHVDTDNMPVAIRFLHNALNVGKIHADLRATLYERAISALFMKGNFEQSAKIATRMTSDGILPTNKLRALLAINEAARQGNDGEALCSQLQAIFRDLCEEDTKDLLRWVLVFVRQLNNHADIAERIVRTILNISDVGYRLDVENVSTMIKTHLKAGDRQSALRWLDYHSASLQQSDAQTPSYEDSLPYTAYIEGLIAFCSDPSSIYLPILERMKRESIQPTTRLVNVLMLAEIEKARFTKAIQLYKAVRYGELGWNCPDDNTYALLYTAHRKLTARQRALLTSAFSSEQVPSPRMLFSEMCSVRDRIGHGQMPSSKALTTRSLNSALRCFVEIGDYAAAQVTLSTFDRKNIYIDNYTSACAINPLAQRCRHELSPRRNSRDTSSWSTLR